MVESPVTVHAPAGPLQIRVEIEGNPDMYLIGPAEIIGAGEFFCGKIKN